jgi:Carboxypeptidase regulatory-like domain
MRYLPSARGELQIEPNRTVPSCGLCSSDSRERAGSRRTHRRPRTKVTEAKGSLAALQSLLVLGKSGSMIRLPTRFLLFWSFVQILGYAQDSSGVAITGTVLDPHQAGILGAKVTLKQVDRNELRSTNADALVRGVSIPPGNYEVRIEQEGFKTHVSRVRAGDQPPRSLHVVLALADLQQQVTVGDQLTQVSTNTSDNLDTVTLNRQSLDDLPSFDQNYIATMSRFLDASFVGTNGVTLVVDGVEATRAGVSASAIQEVKINQDPDSAEYPRPGRGRIEIVTRPGSSEFHGTFNFLFRDYHLNARDPFALIRPPEQRRIFEGSLTGPLGRGKKTSFLISAQGTVFALGPSGEIRETVPTSQRNTELGGSLNHQFGDNHLISIRGIYTDRTIRNQPESISNSVSRSLCIPASRTTRLLGAMITMTGWRTTGPLACAATACTDRVTRTWTSAGRAISFSPQRRTTRARWLPSALMPSTS